MFKTTATLVLAASSCFFVNPISSTEFDSDWMQWRGPEGTGYAADSAPPIEFSDEKNVKWKVKIPGYGHASPIVMGDRVYLMTAIRTDRQPDAVEDAKSEDANDGNGDTETNESGDNNANAASQQGQRPRPRMVRGVRGGAGQDGAGRGGRGRGGRGGPPVETNIHKFVVICLDRNDGSEIWSTTVCEEVPHEGTHPTASQASGSPVTDGEHLFAFFGSRGLFCLDLEGNVVWQKDLGDQTIRNSFGEGASPAVHGNVIVVPWDHEGDSFVAAFDKSTGEELWRNDRTERTTWATPVITMVDDQPQAILVGTDATIGYALETGEEIWRCSGLTANVVPTPIVKDGICYITSGFRGSALLAIDLAEAKGDISDTAAVLWSFDRGTPYIPSPLLMDGRLYFLRTTSGVVSCVDVENGVQLYVGERLENVANIYASLVGANGHIYICGLEGNVAVLKGGDTFEIVAENSLGEGINATPAIVDDEMFIRGTEHLFCIAATEG